MNDKAILTIDAARRHGKANEFAEHARWFRLLVAFGLGTLALFLGALGFWALNFRARRHVHD